MNRILNIVFAWFSFLLLALLSVIYPMRLYAKKQNLPASHWINKTNRLLRKIHKGLGILLIPFIFLHCRFSSQKLGINTGSIILAASLLLFASYLCRKKFKKWMNLHRKLTLILWIVLSVHIIITRSWS